MSLYLIAEIGINHNGDLEIAKELIRHAAAAGFDAVKFQKRTIDHVYTKEFLQVSKRELLFQQVCRLLRRSMKWLKSSEKRSAPSN